MTPIHYTSDQPADYAIALGEAETLAKLKDTVAAWQELAADAHAIVQGMDEAAFLAWRKGLRKERRGQFAGDEFAKKYAAVLMPERMFKVALMALEYHVPWGLMYTRLKDTGNLDKALA